MKIADLEKANWLARPFEGAAGESKRDGEALPAISRAALGLGAWFAGLFFAAFLASGLGLLFRSGSGIAGAGLAVVAASLVVERFGRGVFVGQVALSWNFAGTLLFLVGLAQSGGGWTEALFRSLVGAVLLCPFVYWLSRHPVQRFLSVAWVWAAGAPFAFASASAELAIGFAVVGLGLFVLGAGGFVGPRWRPAARAGLAGLLGLLVSCAWQWNWIDAGFLAHVSRVAGVLVPVVFFGLLWHLNRPRGAAAGLHLVSGGLLLALGLAGAPGLAAAAGLMATARARRDRVLAGLGAVALVAFLVLFYYSLDTTLLAKSLWLAGKGCVLLATAAVAKLDPHLLPEAEEGPADGDASDGPELVAPRLPLLPVPPGGRLGGFAVLVALANLALVLVLVNGAVTRKQAIVSTGRSVFLELRPINPRSLIQGDYMVLRPALAGTRMPEEGATRGLLALEIDGQGVARAAPRRGDAADTGDAGDADTVIRYRRCRDGLRFGIESFFFEEGSAAEFERARYAEVRLSPGGDAVLVGLRSADLVPLGSR